MVIEKRPPFAPPSFFRILQGLATCERERERAERQEISVHFKCFVKKE